MPTSEPVPGVKRTELELEPSPWLDHTQLVTHMSHLHGREGTQVTVGALTEKWPGRGGPRDEKQQMSPWKNKMFF